MSLKRTIIDLLDHKGGRTLLGKITTLRARRELGSDVEVLHDGRLWIHRSNSMYFPDDRKFCYHGTSFRNWSELPTAYFENAQDYYLRHYRLREGDVVFDVGAGRGEDTLAFSRAVGQGGRVIAIEAHPLSYELLEAFCRLNRLENVSPINLAIMDKRGEISMVESDNWRANAVSMDDPGGNIKVPARTLDEVCRELLGVQHIDFLKMNIEGAERYALAGMESIVRSTNAMCIACHDFLGDRGLGEHYRTRQFVEGFLADHGFTTVSYPDDPRDYVRCHVFASRTGA
jgi:FkbM family methyltransferase